MLSKISIPFYFSTIKCMIVSNFPYYFNHQLLYLIVAMLVDVTGYLTVILICIFLITTEFENTFVSLLAIHIFSLVICLFITFTHF